MQYFYYKKFMQKRKTIKLDDMIMSGKSIQGLEKSLWIEIVKTDIDNTSYVLKLIGVLPKLVLMHISIFKLLLVKSK